LSIACLLRCPSCLGRPKPRRSTRNSPPAMPVSIAWACRSRRMQWPSKRRWSHRRLGSTLYPACWSRVSGWSCHLDRAERARVASWPLSWATSDVATARRCDWLDARAGARASSTSLRYGCGSCPLSLADCSKLITIAARCPASSLPANNHARPRSAPNMLPCIVLSGTSTKAVPGLDPAGFSHDRRMAPSGAGETQDPSTRRPTPSGGHGDCGCGWGSRSVIRT
jgi:hypothetical protein